MLGSQTELIVTANGSEVARRVVEPGEYVIGRDADCQLVVDAEQVSRKHAKLIIHGQEVFIEDLGSANGTFVNGQRITGRSKVEPGHQVQIGSAVLELRRVEQDNAAGRDAGATVAAAPGVTTDPRFSASGEPQADIVRRVLPEAVRGGRKYEIGKVVARGGMGAILDARETAIERTVAMKIVLDAESPDALARFVTEAKVTGQLEHPHIVPVHELGVDEKEQIFYTMKFVRGDTLRKVLDLLAKGDAETIAKYPLAHLLTIFQKVCDAMAFAHSKGVIHRDLKPDNIMLGDYGEVLVMDWGLAKVLGQAETAAPAEQPRVSTASNSDSGVEGTMEGTVMGTPQYMPPEQAHGWVAQMDARSDIYSLGAILYHILTLRPSVTGGNALQVLFQVCSGNIVPPAKVAQASSLRSDDQTQAGSLRHLPGGRVPESLSAVTMKAMALKREDRYQSVPELQREIEAYQNGFATSAEHASLLKQLVLLIKRHKAVFSTAFAAGLLITVLTVWFVIKITASERAARAAEAVAVEEKESTRQALATTALALAEAAFREQDGPAMQAALNEVPDDLRDSNWNYLIEKSDTSLATIRPRSTGGFASASPHPKQPGVFAMAGSDHLVSLVEIRTGAKLLEFQPGFKDKSSMHYRLAFSPDGERLAIGRPGVGGIVIHSARDGKKLAEWETADTNELQFSPDGRQLLEVVYSNQINLWEAATGRRLWMAPKATHAVFDPGGKMILVTFQQNLKLLKAQDGSLLRQLPDARDNITSIAIRPDGARALISDRNGFVRCLDLRDGRILYEMRANDRTVWALAYTPEGGRFVTLAMLSGGRQSLQLWDADKGTLLQPLLGVSSGSIIRSSLSVHPVSGEIVVAGDVTKAWNLTGQQEKWRLPVTSAAQRIAFWKTDDWIFKENRGTSVELVDLQTTDPIKRPIWKPEAPFYRLVSVSADGRFAAVGNSTKGQIHFLRLNGQTVEEVRAFPIKEGTIYQMELSPTGDRLWIGKIVVDPATGAELLRVDSKGIMNAPFRPCWLNNTEVIGSSVAKAPRGQPGSEEQLSVWDATTGQRSRIVTNRSVILSLAVAPDGRTVAEAGADKMVRLRDAATLEVKREFRTHDGPITALAFHPTHPILATASEDLTIKLWNLDTGRLLEELRGPRSAPRDLVFSPSGIRLACLTSSDHLTRIWEPPSLNLDASAKADAGGWEDLLAQLKRDDVAKNGNGWQLNNGTLLSSSNGYSSIALPGSFAQSNYQVRVKLRQLKPQDAFEVILPVADRQVAFKLDGYPKEGFFTSLLMLEGKGGRDVPGALKGKQVQDSDQHELELTVRLEAANASIEARLDGQPLYQWSGPVTALSLFSKWPALPPGTLALGAHRADWLVYAVKVKRLDAKP